MNKILLVILFLVLSCSSTPNVVGKLDLTAEKQMILDSMDIPEVKKQFIVNTFDKAESFCNDAVTLVNSLYKVIDEQKAEIKTLNEQARIYRFFRNLLLGAIFGYILYRTRNLLLPIAKRLLGIPV